MLEINYKPIFDYLDKAMEQLKSELATKAEIQKIQKSLDALLEEMEKRKRPKTAQMAK